jgi:mxaD protein
MKFHNAILGLFFSASLVANAADANKLKVEEKVEVNANAAQVWEKVNKFGDLGAWHPAVANTTIQSGAEAKVGAVRVLTLQDGGKITEELKAYDANKKMFTYRIIEGVLPVSHYVSTVQVTSLASNKTLVTWVGHFQRKDLSATPAQGQDDAAAVNTITAVYRAGLDNLKKISE